MKQVLVIWMMVVFLMDLSSCTAEAKMQENNKIIQEWDDKKAYKRRDKVLYEGTVYEATRKSKRKKPSASFVWKEYKEIKKPVVKQASLPKAPEKDLAVVPQKPAPVAKTVVKPKPVPVIPKKVIPVIATVVPPKALAVVPEKTLEVDSRIVYKNADIYTVDKKALWADALVIENGKIVFVGNNHDVLKYEKSASEIIDMKGKMILPGFHDVNTYALEAGSSAYHFKLDYKQKNIHNFAANIKKAAKDFPHERWLIGYGHNIKTLLDSDVDPLFFLDSLVSDRPLVIVEKSTHSVWVNSKALERVRFNKYSKHPAGGFIFTDHRTSRLNGLLFDNAGTMVLNLALKESTPLLKQYYLGLVNSTLPTLSKYGVTSICEAQSYWKRGHHKVWKKLRDDKKLSLRVSLGLWGYPEMDDKQQIKKLVSLYENDESSLLKINQIKLYRDGVTRNTTAAMKWPYKSKLLNIKGNKGLTYFSQNRLGKYIKALEPIGYDFHIHASGNLAVHEALNAIAQDSEGRGRHSISQVEIVNYAEYKRFKQLNVTMDAHVANEFSNPEYWSELNKYIGKEKAKIQIPIRSLLRYGSRITLSSDGEENLYNPLVGISNAITRAPENISLKSAIAAYTINAAYVMHQEDKVGSIEVGKEADIIVLDKNLFDLSASQILKVKVLQTLLAGEEVYRSPSFK